MARKKKDQRVKMELDNDLVLLLPGETEAFGTHNLKVVGAFAARSIGKLNKYAEDDHFSIMEKFGMYRIVKQGIKLREEVDFVQLRKEYADLSQDEWNDIEAVVKKEYFEYIEKEEEIGDIAQELIGDFIAAQESFKNLFKRRGIKSIA